MAEATGSKLLQKFLPDDALKEPSFCRLCAAITYEAVNSEGGYTHVEDAADLRHSEKTCDLCRLITLALVESARHGIAGEQILTLNDAIAEFESHWQRNGTILKHPRPVFLKLSPFLPNILEVSTVLASAESKAVGRHHMRTRHPAYLLLHGSGHLDQKPMIPRPELSQFLKRLGIGLWGPKADHQPLMNLPEVKLPDRVLDLSTCFTEPGRRIRLVETANISKGRYAALSYCWGGYRGCLTETKSYNARCECIRLVELPPLFRDVCYVTWYWGIRYIWIDALCIIQDNPADREHQAAQMADIYRNCAVRIAATSAKNPTCRILAPGPTITSIRVKQFENPSRRSSHEGKCFVSYPRIYEKEVDLGRLNSRAWVLQERLLAPRTVHFCKDHIYFETERWGIIGEDLVSQFEHRFTSVAKDGINRARMMQKRITGRSYKDEDDTSDSWLRIAELYSDCQITFSTDKLVALAGLIKDRQECGKFPYRGSKNYLGMWASTLHEDLLWTSVRSAKTTFLKDFNLPTWAWIAYEGSVRFLKDRRSMRHPRTMQTSPIREFELLDITGSPQSTRLPLTHAVKLSVKLKLAKIPAFGYRIPKRPAATYRAFTGDPPFRHWPGTFNQPIPLVTYDDCTVITDTAGRAIGYASRDTDEDPTKLDLWCAHIATLHDETYRGPDPLSRFQYAVNVDQVTSITTMGLGPEYKKTTDTHILAYALVVSRKGATGNEFRRHGIAEVQYEWINRAEATTISLV